MVLALVVGTARLAFTGTVRFAPGPGGVAAGAATGENLAAPGGGAAASSATASAKAVTGAARVNGAVLVVEGFGSTCCHGADALRAAGGLLGDRLVQRVVETFLVSGEPSDQDLDDLAGGSQQDLRGAAQLIAAAAAAWRMPDLHPACPGS